MKMIARMIPMDVHTMGDYPSGVAQMLIALFVDYRAYRRRSLGFRR